MGKKEEPEPPPEILADPEAMELIEEGFEYAPEAAAFANWLLEHDVDPLDALNNEPDAGPLRGFFRRIFGE